MIQASKRSSSGLAVLGLRHPVLLAFAVIMAVVGTIIAIVMSDGQRRIIEHEAVRLAEVVGRQAVAARTVYARDVVSKLTNEGFGSDVDSSHRVGYVPLPAQFLHHLGKESTHQSDGLYSFRMVSQWNLSPFQGLGDDFQRWGWGELIAQQPVGDGSSAGGAKSEVPQWVPVWRIEQLAGVRTLRYLRADPASAAGCVSCHNAYENTPEIRQRRIQQGVTPGKQYQLNQLMGAIEVRVPIDRVEAIAAAQTSRTLWLVVSIALLGLSAAAAFAVQDIRQKQRLSRNFERQASFDALTGLPNRVLFANHAAREIVRCQLEHASMALLFIDVDRFKTINDSLGHEAGDRVLRNVAGRLRRSLRGRDMVARHSGDEFTVLLTGPCSDADITRHVRHLLKRLCTPLRVDNEQLYLSASIGVSRYPADGTTLSELLKHADAAMYRAKENGRNGFELYTKDMNGQMDAPMSLRVALREAMEKEQFELHYQPRVSLLDGRILSAEALIRWRHPERGLVMPGQFLPIIDDMGATRLLGDWVLRAALKQRRDWTEAGLPLFRVAVNVSPLQFQAVDFVLSVQRALKDTGISADLLEFEITEGTLVHHPEKVIETLRRFHDMGIVLSLDDFGTGYSSLSYLKQFPIDTLKIDKSFVDGLPNDANDRTLTNAIIGLSHSLKLKVVAEGVETVGQLQYLAAQGCEEVQGFLLARPAPPADIEPLLRAGRLMLPLRQPA